MVAIAALFRAPIVNGLCQAAKPGRQVGTSHLVPHRSTFLSCGQHFRPREDGKVSGNDRKIDRAALGNLTHGAGAPAFDQARQQGRSRRIAQGLEQVRVQRPVDRRLTPSGGFGCGRVVARNLHNTASMQRLRHKIKSNQRLVCLLPRRDLLADSFKQRLRGENTGKLVERVAFVFDPDVVAVPGIKHDAHHLDIVRMDLVAIGIKVM